MHGGVTKFISGFQTIYSKRTGEERCGHLLRPLCGKTWFRRNDNNFYSLWIMNYSWSISTLTSFYYRGDGVFQKLRGSTKGGKRPTSSSSVCE